MDFGAGHDRRKIQPRRRVAKWVRL